MPDTKISLMTAATSLTGAEVLPIVQGGANKTTTVALMQTPWTSNINAAGFYLSNVSGLFPSVPVFFPTGYTYAQQITLPHTLASADVANEAVPIKILHNASIYNHALSNGYDVRFYDANMNPLTFEREFYARSGAYVNTSFWVLIPNYSHTVDTVIYMVYGNASATDASNGAGTWNSNYLGVYHLADGADGSSTTLNGNDSTGVANMTATGTNSGASFSGSYSTQVSAYANYMGSENFSRTYVGLPSGNAVRGFEFYMSSTYPSSGGYYLMTYGSGSNTFKLQISGSGVLYVVQGSTTLWVSSIDITVGGMGVGHYVALFYDGTKFYLYVDGVLKGTSGTISTLNTILGTTNLTLPAPTNGANVKIDEFRILTSIPANLTSYLGIQNGLMLPAKGYTLGAETTGINTEIDYTNNQWNVRDKGVVTATFDKTNGVTATNATITNETVTNLNLPTLGNTGVIPFVGTNGLLTANPNFTYNQSNNTIVASRLEVTQNLLLNNGVNNRGLIYLGNNVATTDDIRADGAGHLGLLMADDPTVPFQLGGDYTIGSITNNGVNINYVSSPVTPTSESVTVNYEYSQPNITGLTLSFTSDPSGFLANGTTYQYDVYEYDGYNIGSRSYTATTASQIDQNDGQYYANSVNWDEIGSNNYIIVRTIILPDTSTEVDYTTNNTNSFYDTPSYTDWTSGNIPAFGLYTAGHTFDYTVFGTQTLPTNNILYSYTGYNTLNSTSLSTTGQSTIGNVQGFSATQSASGGSYQNLDSIWYEVFEEFDVSSLSIFSPTDGGNSGSPVVISGDNLGIDIAWTPDSIASQYVLIRHYIPNGGMEQIDCQQTTSTSFTDDGTTGWNAGTYDLSQKALWYTVEIQGTQSIANSARIFQTVDSILENYIDVSNGDSFDITDSPATIWTGTASVLPTTNPGYWDSGITTNLSIYAVATFSGQKVMSTTPFPATATDDNNNNSYYYIEWYIFPVTSQTGTVWHNTNTNDYIENTSNTLYDDNTAWTNITPITYPSVTSPSIKLDNSGKLWLVNLPTSSAGLPSGALWNNGGTINVV